MNRRTGTLAMLAWGLVALGLAGSAWAVVWATGSSSGPSALPACRTLGLSCSPGHFGTIPLAAPVPVPGPVLGTTGRGARTKRGTGAAAESGAAPSEAVGPTPSSTASAIASAPTSPSASSSSRSDASAASSRAAPPVPSVSPARPAPSVPSTSVPSTSVPSTSVPSTSVPPSVPPAPSTPAVSRPAPVAPSVVLTDRTVPRPRTEDTASPPSSAPFEKGRAPYPATSPAPVRRRTATAPWGGAPSRSAADVQRHVVTGSVAARRDFFVSAAPDVPRRDLHGHASTPTAPLPRRFGSGVTPSPDRAPAVRGGAPLRDAEGPPNGTGRQAAVGGPAGVPARWGTADPARPARPARRSLDATFRSPGASGTAGVTKPDGTAWMSTRGGDAASDADGGWGSLRAVPPPS